MEVKQAKSEAKKGNHLFSPSLANEFQGKGEDEKREIVNATLAKLRGLQSMNSVAQVCIY